MNHYVFVVTNSGTDTLDLSAVNVTGAHAGDFTVDSYPATVAPASSGSLVVTFDPSVVGTRSATITVVSDDYDESSYDFAVQGIGTPPKGTVIRVY